MAYARFPGTPHDGIGEGEEYELRPASTRLYSIDVDIKVVGWRVECFEARGMSHVQAMALAIRRDVDRAHVERLLDEGATVEQVMELVL